LKYVIFGGKHFINMEKIRPFEIFLAQVVIYLLLWLFNDYLASLLSIIFGTICLLILLISIIVEVVERSKVPRWYFIFMGASVLAPVVAALVYLTISGGVEWMRK